MIRKFTLFENSLLKLGNITSVKEQFSRLVKSQKIIIFSTKVQNMVLKIEFSTPCFIKFYYSLTNIIILNNS